VGWIGGVLGISDRFLCRSVLDRKCLGALFGEDCHTAIVGALVGYGMGKVLARPVGWIMPKIGAAFRRIGPKPPTIADDIAGALDEGLPAGYCFSAGTPVKTDKGDVPIEQIEAGDTVWSADPHSGRWEKKKVLEPLVRDYRGTLYAITVLGERIEATGEHPFWVLYGADLAARPPPHELSERDMAPSQSGGRWVAAKDLRVGDVLLLSGDKEGRVEAITAREVSQKVYNLRVEEFQTYTVGKIGAVVHNNPCGASGRQKNKLTSVREAKGAHSTFRRDHAGRINHYAEYQPNGSIPCFWSIQ
jgi:hypothetical protein